MPAPRYHSSVAKLRNPHLRWGKAFRRFERNNRHQVRTIMLLGVLFLLFGRGRDHPTEYPAEPDLLEVPREGEDPVRFAHKHARDHKLPVYIFYKARSGQLNNQLISFFNALTIAKAANATLVAPFAFYGSESYVDFGTGKGFFFHLRQYFDLYVYQRVLKSLGLFYKHDQLIGDYFDGTLLNRSQPVISIMEFLESRGAKYLRKFPHVLTRRGDAPFFYMTLGQRSLFAGNVNIRGDTIREDLDIRESAASRRELDCNFNASDHFRGLSYSAGVNGNFLFLSKLYRSHSLNCTSVNPYWLQIRKHVQPRVEIRQLVSSTMKQWGKVMAVHLRLFPFDQGKFTASGYCNFFLSKYQHRLQEVDRVYIAYSVSSKLSVDIVSQLKKRLGSSKIISAEAYDLSRRREAAFDRRYSAPIIDMWTCVNSDIFVGRLGSSLSWNVVYWRQALDRNTHGHGHDFYSLADFSDSGAKNPTDTYGF